MISYCFKSGLIFLIDQYDLLKESSELAIVGLFLPREDITEDLEQLLSLHVFLGHLHPEDALQLLRRFHVHLLHIIPFAKYNLAYVLMSASIFFSNSLS